LTNLTHNSTDARVGNKKTMNDHDLHNMGIEPTMISQRYIGGA
jgi:hypothetical protein